MSAEKHQQLIDEGKLWPDGTYVLHCPSCHRLIEQGEVIPGITEPFEGPEHGTAQAQATVATASAGQADGTGA